MVEHHGRATGKRVEPSIDAMTTGGSTNSRRLFVYDSASKSKFLIDTGADVSVIPPTQMDKQRATDLLLYAANHGTIRTFGERALSLNLGLRRPIKWIFCIAEVPYPIIGADLIHKYGLIVNLRQGQLVDPITGCKSAGMFAHAPVNSITVIVSDSKYTDLLKQFPELLGNPSNHTSAKHNIRHFIKTTGPPCAQRVRPLRPERLKQAKKEFQIMLDFGYIRPSKSPWASPLHMVPKKDGDWRPCGDFRELNNKTEVDRTPISRLQDCAYNLAKNLFQD